MPYKLIGACIPIGLKSAEADIAGRIVWQRAAGQLTRFARFKRQSVAQILDSQILQVPSTRLAKMVGRKGKLGGPNAGLPCCCSSGSSGREAPFRIHICL